MSIKGSVLVVVALAAVCLAAPLHSEDEYQKLFRAFINQFEKSYAHDEFHLYYNNFKDNLDLIEKVRNPPISLFSIWDFAYALFQFFFFDFSTNCNGFQWKLAMQLQIAAQLWQALLDDVNE